MWFSFYFNIRFLFSLCLCITSFSFYHSVFERITWMYAAVVRVPVLIASCLTEFKCFYITVLTTFLFRGYRKIVCFVFLSFINARINTRRQVQNPTHISNVFSSYLLCPFSFSFFFLSLLFFFLLLFFAVI